MNIFKQKKLEKIKIIQEKFDKSSSIVFVQYHGLTVPQIQDLRKNLKNGDSEMKVFKNSLMRIALKERNFDLSEYLLGPNAIIFAYGEANNPFKISNEFAKENPALKFIGGVYENKIIGDVECKEISTLPTKEEALIILAKSMISPLQQISVSLDLLIKEDKLTNKETTNG